MGKSYIAHYLRCTSGQYDMVKQALSHLNVDTYRFFCHLMVGRYAQKDNDGWVTLPSETWRKDMPNADWQALVDIGLIDYKEYRQPSAKGAKDGKSREYKIIDEAFLLDFIDIGHTDIQQGQTVYKNLFTGRPVERIKTANHNESRKPYPPFIVKAMAAIPYGYIDRRSVERHLADLRDDIDEFRKFENDANTYNQILQQKLDEVQRDGYKGIIRFQQAWEPKSTGRIFGKNGLSVQSASKEMKDAMYELLPCQYNYDLSQSQARLLLNLYQFIKPQLQTTKGQAGEAWLLDLLKNKQRRAEYAEQVGINEKLFKDGLYGIIFGGNPKFKNSEVYQNLTKGLVNDNEKELVRNRFVSLIEPLMALVRVLQEYLYECCQSPGKYHFMTVRHFGQKIHVENACGMRLTLTDLNQTERRRKLTSHIIQGLESCLIHAYTIYTAGIDGVEVISNEHDGLVILKDFEKISEIDKALTLLWPQIRDNACQIARKINNGQPVDLDKLDNQDAELFKNMALKLKPLKEIEPFIKAHWAYKYIAVTELGYVVNDNADIKWLKYFGGENPYHCISPKDWIEDNGTFKVNPKSLAMHCKFDDFEL